MSYVLVLYHSTYGATESLAKVICEGVLDAGGEYRLRKVEGATGECPVVTAEDYENAAAWIVGSPTRFGNMASAMKKFFDSLGGFWMQGGLKGKPVAVFTSTSSLHGGQESTLLSMHIPLLHLGGVIVGIPFYQTGLAQTQSGGTPYGASHWASAPGSVLTDSEKDLARVLGKRVTLLSQQITQPC